jgi:hypothetical protein
MDLGRRITQSTRPAGQYLLVRFEFPTITHNLLSIFAQLFVYSLPPFPSLPLQRFPNPFPSSIALPVFRQFQDRSLSQLLVYLHK